MAYEMGVKTQVGRRLRASASAFYYDYKDFQAFTFDQLAQVISNRPAKVKGIEGELVASPTEHWDVMLGFSALDSSVDGVTTSNGAVTRSRHMVLSPDFAVNGLLRYRLPVGGGRELSFQTDGRYVGKQYFDLQNNPIATEKGHAVMNASITLSGADERWNVSVWVKNLANEQYRAYAIPVTSLGFTQQMIGEPRWVGASVGYKW
jgi:iron complex outermembrane receptor protein